MSNPLPGLRFAVPIDGDNIAADVADELLAALKGQIEQGNSLHGQTALARRRKAAKGKP